MKPLSAGDVQRAPLRRPKQETLDELDKIRSKIDTNFNLEEDDSLSFLDYIQPDPKQPYIDTHLEMSIPNISRPIGVTLLVNGDLVVGDRGKDVVYIYDQSSGKRRHIQPGRPFKRPSDMVTLLDGRFAVRDDNGLQLFDETGGFIKTVVPKGELGLCFGLATDGRGHLITINTNKKGMAKCTTNKDETDILIIDVETGTIEEKIQLIDVISDPKKSSCKFLCCDGKKLFISDLGLNLVYVMKLGSNSVKAFGHRGKGPGEFVDVAGVAVDAKGNTMVVDACNNRIQVCDSF